MKQIITIIAMLSLLSLNLWAKESYFNPYEPKPKKSLKRVTKPSIVKTKVEVKAKKKVVKRVKLKTKKKRYTKITKRLSSHLDKIYKQVSKKTNISKIALKKAFSFYKKNQTQKALSSKYLAIADYTKTAKNKRLYIINLNNGDVYRHKIAHGKYSGSLGGRVKHSSNRRNSKMTPYGFFKIGSKVGKTKKKHYRYLSVKGLEWSNKKVGYPSSRGGRDVIMHPAKYVNSG